MQIIHLSYPVKKNIVPGKIVLALGFFDGVHRGHQQLIKVAKNTANSKGLPLVLMTFDRHPKEVYQNQVVSYIDTLDEKIYKMRQLGVDYLLVMHFNEQFSKVSAQEFVDNIIVKLNTETVVAGFDYTYGPKNIANMQNLPKFAQNRFEIITVPEQTYNDQKIGSTEIKRAIKNGKMDLVKDLLGTPYVMSGYIGHGLRNGHKLGFPTANLVWDENKVIPKVGVYATRTMINGKWYESMTSVGYNVTINSAQKIYIESNLFGFSEEAYDQKIIIKWYKYTRGEIKFANLNQLKEQMKQDKLKITDYFEQYR
ncbi:MULTISPECIES: riboflavin biosynthesis protein RibF [unclassified Lactobacillus]|uniref:riboflavin biosynthesis protein RibF n=1 Tax=unclassified Lactobacillus TaxID=2620435 RepID=UPI000EFC2B25|nr:MULTISPECIES: riboflavin biosynthesis protein RibF [unclassified Lactobacillus]RMC39461.1 riboflavin biosynthesis protein RibF [Lactobacillus sp. ESL0237]RMC43525.1 riboflavin biosynthesis protein RibF [Lactobacillus sp. ESL0234]RMC45007.1 riboflavin biosynthesis protein RibF [Lactobacillus sp. ESL0236]RMC46609.1 riboflavin biosynthesis protein RibF [Lactobacillus sp. ESL0230]RMC50884.1 riboflavin biosynthesis protein RibF [Lactobacillus sp. ESL0225]